MNAHATFVNYTKYIDKDIFEIDTDPVTNVKTIEFFGYISDSYGESDLYPYKITQFSGNIANINAWLRKGKPDADESNDYFGGGRKVYVDPCTEKHVINMINNWANGIPLLEGSLANADKLPDGIYINMNGEVA